MPSPLHCVCWDLAVNAWEMSLWHRIERMMLSAGNPTTPLVPRQFVQLPWVDVTPPWVL